MASLAQQDKTVRLLEQLVPDNPDFIMSQVLPQYWETDAEVRKSFLSHISMWEQGLITCVELVQRMYQEINKEI